MKKRKKIKNNPNKFKTTSIVFGILSIIMCISTATFLILDLFNIVPLDEKFPNYYTYKFFNDAGGLIYKKTILRGEKFDEVVSEPEKGDETKENERISYTFKGWDINGDKIPDIIPKYAYFNIDARPIYKSHTTSLIEVIL